MTVDELNHRPADLGRCRATRPDPPRGQLEEQVQPSTIFLLRDYWLQMLIGESRDPQKYAQGCQH